MSYKKLISLSFLVYFCVAFISTVVAEEKKERELPSSGLIAGSKSGGFGANSIEGPWGGIDPNGDQAEANPISGSVSNIGGGYWIAKIFNNSEDKYRASIEILEFDNSNKQVRRKPMTIMLKGGESTERKFRATPRTSHAAIKLKSWSRTKKKKTQEELKAEIDQKNAELKELKQEAGLSE